MYCNNCGKHNSDDSKFCKSCGSKITRVSIEHKSEVEKHTQNNSPVVDSNKSTEESEKINAGLGGWLALVGLGLIVTPFIEGYSTYEYFPLLEQVYDIPSLKSLLWFEFFGGIATIVVSIYLLYLYFKKNINFPKYYIIYLVAITTFAVLDYIFLASIRTATLEQQETINGALSDHAGELFRSIIASLIWGTYITKSKRVKATFVHA
jgi:hypothetical protein